MVQSKRQIALPQRLLFGLLFMLALISLSAESRAAGSVTLSANPTTITVQQGFTSNLTATITATPAPGTVGGATLSLGSWPSGVTGSLNLGSVSFPPPIPQSGTLTFSVGPFVAPGTYSLPVQGSGSIPVTGTSVTLVVTAFPAPTNVQASGGDTIAAITWTPVTPLPGQTLQGYNIYRVSGNSYAKINSAPVPMNAYIDTGLTDGTAYSYAVTAVEGTPTVHEGPYSATSAATTPTALTASQYWSYVVTGCTPANTPNATLFGIANNYQTSLGVIATSTGNGTKSMNSWFAPLPPPNPPTTVTWQLTWNGPAALLLVKHFIYKAYAASAYNGPTAQPVTATVVDNYNGGIIRATATSPSTPTSVYTAPAPTYTLSVAPDAWRHFQTTLTTSLTSLQPITTGGVTTGWTNYVHSVTVTTDYYPPASLAHFGTVFTGIVSTGANITCNAISPTGATGTATAAAHLNEVYAGGN